MYIFELMIENWLTQPNQQLQVCQQTKFALKQAKVLAKKKKHRNKSLIHKFLRLYFAGQPQLEIRKNEIPFSP